MALAEIASLIPPISISIAGILDVDIDLNGHKSVGLPFTSTTSTSTRTTAHTTTFTSPVAKTTTTTGGSPVIVTTTPNTPNTSPEGRTTLSTSPTVRGTQPTLQHTTSPPLDSPSASPIRIVTSVPGVVASPSQGSSSSVGGAGNSTSTLTGLGGIPVAAAEGLPTVGVTVVSGSTIRPTPGITEPGLATVTGGPSAAATNTSSTNSPNSRHGAALSSGVVAAIIVCLLLVLLCFIFFLLRRRRTRRDQDTILWRLRSYGANTFRRNAHSALSIPFHSRKRSLQEAASMLAPTSPRSPTFVIRPMSQALQSTPSVLTDTTRSLYYDARTSISSAVSAAESSHHSSEETWQTAEHTLHSEHSSFPLKPEIHIGFDSTSPANHVVHIPSPISIPNSAFRLTTTPIPPLPPLPSSPPPLPPSPRTPKFPVVTLNPFDPSQSPTRPAFEVKYTDPFQDPMD